jgi:hypothetical protein
MTRLTHALRRVPPAVRLALGLAACSEEEAKAPAEQSAPATTEAAPEPAPAPAPAAETQATSGSDVSDAAQQACLSAVSNETNEGDVAVLSTEFSEANSLVMIGVGAQRAPWRCLVSNDGAVQEVMFTGDDSAGVDQSAAPAENSATADGGGGAMAGSQSSSDVSDAAQQACLSAVSNETNEGDVAVLSTEFSEANSMVMVGVGAQRAPWRCLVSNDGAVQEVSFSGSEGAL